MDADGVDKLPEGYLRDSAGRLVPVANIKPEHLLEDDLVRKLADTALEHSKRLADFKAAAFEEIGVLVSLLAQKYGAQPGGSKGNLTLNSFDGSIRVQVAVGDRMEFGPELQAAKGLIDDCLERWSQGANPHIRAIIHDAFDVGDQGKIQIDRILALRRLAIDDPTWQNAMQAIGDALRVTSSKRYIRFYRRPAPGREHVQLQLDIARV